MAPRTALVLFCWTLSALLPGCGCHGDSLVNSEPGQTQPPVTAPSSPYAANNPLPVAPDAGPAPVVDAGSPLQPSSWCASDCDCPAGTRCLATTGELTANSCEPGTNTCTQTCASTCGSGTQCLNGACTVAPCVGANCPSTTFPISVAGTYDTVYQFDIHDFANKVGEIGKLLTILSAAFNGNVTCSSGLAPDQQLLCIVVSLVAQNLHPPPWVQSLLTILSDLFKFGDHPITAKGVMQLAEGANAQLAASEVWSEMWLDYNGQQLNVMNAPTLGSAGQIKVTVKAFGGFRDSSYVYLGPRDVEFDVNKLIVNLINVAIQAASNNQAQNVQDLITQALCNQLPVASVNYATCLAAAQQFANQLELPVGLGGIHVTVQKAAIIDANHDGVAEALGTPANTGSVTGSMSNGLVSGALGPYPKSFWYGTRK